MIGKWRLVLAVFAVFVCVAISISQGDQQTSDWEERILNVLRRLNRPNKPRPNQVPGHVLEKWTRNGDQGQGSGQGKDNGQGQGSQQGQGSEQGQDNGQGQGSEQGQVSEQGQDNGQGQGSQQGQGNQQGQSTNSNNGQTTASASGSGTTTVSTVTGVINEGTDTTTYSDDETIERIKNGEIKDAATVFNYLTFERFNWSNETCIKCMMEDFKREIAACYEDRLQYEPGSWEHQSQQRRRRKRSTEYYNCYWCGSCYK